LRIDDDDDDTTAAVALLLSREWTGSQRFLEYEWKVGLDWLVSNCFRLCILFVPDVLYRFLLLYLPPIPTHRNPNLLHTQPDITPGVAARPCQISSGGK
jgi:hypothetical protein